MREVLIDWLIEVCQLYSLHQETLYQAVDIMDRYMSLTEFQVLRDQFQLLGVTCLFVAAKVEEIYPPKLSDFVYITDGLYTAEQMKKQEKLLLQILEFNLQTRVTPSTWLKLFCQQLFSSESSTKSSSYSSSSFNSSLFGGSVSSQTTCSSFLVPSYPEDLYAECIALLSLSHVDYESTRYMPSHIAVCCLVYSMRHFQIDPLTGRYVLKTPAAKGVENHLNAKVPPVNYPANQFHMKTLETMQALLGKLYDRRELMKCMQWMLPLAESRSEIINGLFDMRGLDVGNLDAPNKSLCKIGPALPSLLQKHSKELMTLDRVRTLQTEFEAMGERSKVAFITT